MPLDRIPVRRGERSRPCSGCPSQGSRPGARSVAPCAPSIRSSSRASGSTDGIPSSRSGRRRAARGGRPARPCWAAPRCSPVARRGRSRRFSRASGRCRSPQPRSARICAWRRRRSPRRARSRDRNPSGEVRHEPRLFRNRDLEHRQVRRGRSTRRSSARARRWSPTASSTWRASTASNEASSKVRFSTSIWRSTVVSSRSIETRSMPSRASSGSSGRSGETCSSRQRRREQLGSPLEEECQQPVALVRAAARAVEAGVGGEPLQRHAATGAGDGVAREHARVDATGEPRREWTEPARYERFQPQPQPVQDEPGHAGRAYRTR